MSAEMTEEERERLIAALVDWPVDEGLIGRADAREIVEHLLAGPVAEIARDRAINALLPVEGCECGNCASCHRDFYRALADKNAADALAIDQRRRHAEKAVRELHVRRDDPIREYDCWEGDCEHAPDGYEGDFPAPECPVLAESVCGHCADQTAPNEPWEHMVRPDAYWPCATVRALGGAR